MPVKPGENSLKWAKTCKNLEKPKENCGNRAFPIDFDLPQAAMFTATGSENPHEYRGFLLKQAMVAAPSCGPGFGHLPSGSSSGGGNPATPRLPYGRPEGETTWQLV
jgi:hypothetical protein